MRNELARCSASCTILALALSSVVACDRVESPAGPIDHSELHASASKITGSESAASRMLAKRVHSATARFHSTVQATKAGYAVASPCVASPFGGMGYHWLNEDLVDPTFDPMTPEAILYAPDANGKLHKVAVEYIVINVGQAAPMFGDQPFDVGGTPVPAPHWSLHVWLDKPNPSGLFMPFNPDVQCPASAG